MLIVKIEYSTIIKKISIIFALLCTSMLGAEFMGISLNKIALLPLYSMLAGEMLIGDMKLKINKVQILFIVFCLFASLSGLVALMDIQKSRQYELYTELALKSAIQMIIVYIPLSIFFWNSKSRHQYINYFFKYLILVCRVQCIWAFAQFVCYSFFEFDLNTWLFHNVCNDVLGTKWVVWSYSRVDNSMTLRVTGLTCDAAYLALFMVIGILLEKKVSWKFMFMLSLLFSQSRTGIVSLIFILFIDKIINHKNKINSTVILKGVLGTTLSSVAFFFIYNTVEPVRTQIIYAINRVTNIFNGNLLESTSIHLNYIKYFIQIWKENLNILQKFIGVGPRTAVIEYINFARQRGLAYEHNYLNSLSIECDLADLLIGNGVIGWSLYYLILIIIYFSSHEKIFKDIILLLAIMSFMYQFNSMTFIMLLLIFLLSSGTQRN